MSSLLLRSFKSTKLSLPPTQSRYRFYHDYIRFHTPGQYVQTASACFALPSVASRWYGANTFAFTNGNRCCNFEGRQRVRFFTRTNIPIVETSPSHQEDYHAIAALSLDPEGLRMSIQKSIGIDWEPENAIDPVARQVVFVGLYDGYVNQQTRSLSTEHKQTADMAVLLSLNIYVRSCTVYSSLLTKLTFPNYFFGSRIWVAILKGSQVVYLRHGSTAPKTRYLLIWRLAPHKHFLKLVRTICIVCDDHVPIIFRQASFHRKRSEDVWCNSLSGHTPLFRPSRSSIFLL